MKVQPIFSLQIFTKATFGHFLECHTSFEHERRFVFRQMVKINSKFKIAFLDSWEV